MSFSAIVNLVPWSISVSSKSDTLASSWAKELLLVSSKVFSLWSNSSDVTWRSTKTNETIILISNLQSCYLEVDSWNKISTNFRFYFLCKGPFTRCSSGNGFSAAITWKCSHKHLRQWQINATTVLVCHCHSCKNRVRTYLLALPLLQLLLLPHSVNKCIRYSGIQL